MVKIEVLGTSCAKCKSLLMNVEKAVQESCIQAETIKVDKHPRDHGPRGDDDSGTQY